MTYTPDMLPNAHHLRLKKREVHLLSQISDSSLNSPNATELIAIQSELRDREASVSLQTPFEAPKSHRVRRGARDYFINAVRLASDELLDQALKVRRDTPAAKAYERLWTHGSELSVIERVNRFLAPETSWDLDTWAVFQLGTITDEINARQNWEEWAWTGNGTPPERPGELPGWMDECPLGSWTGLYRVDLSSEITGNILERMTYRERDKHRGLAQRGYRPWELEMIRGLRLNLRRMILDQAHRATLNIHKEDEAGIHTAFLIVTQAMRKYERLAHETELSQWTPEPYFARALIGSDDSLRERSSYNPAQPGTDMSLEQRTGTERDSRHENDLHHPCVFSRVCRPRRHA